MKLKRILAAVIAGALMIGLAGCGAGSSGTADNGSAASSTTLKKVVIGTGGTEGLLQENALLAQNLGYIEEELEKAGYYPEYQAFAQAGPAINEALASGSVDIATYGDFPGITAVSNGVDIKVVASANTNMSYGILASKASGITSVADLKGKNVCVGFGTVPYKYFVKILKANGLTTEDVNMINTSTDGPTMIASGDADAIVSAYYAILLQQQGLKDTTIIDNTLDDTSYSTDYVTVARTDYIEENRDAVVAFIKALERAYEYAQENPEDAQKQLATESLTLPIIQEVYSDISFAYFNPDFTEDFETKLRDSIDFLNENGLTGSQVTYEEIVDDSILKEALDK